MMTGSYAESTLWMCVSANPRALGGHPDDDDGHTDLTTDAGW
jgi:hypothetical protein